MGADDWAKRDSFGCVVIPSSGNVVAFGGRYHYASAVLNDVYVSDSAGVGGYGCKCCTLFNHTFQRSLSFCHRPLPRVASWVKQCDAAPWSARYGLGAVVTSTDTVLAIGGGRNVVNPLNDVWQSTDEGGVYCPCTFISAPMHVCPQVATII